MICQGWYDAEPFVVQVQANGQVDVRLGDRIIHQTRLVPTERVEEAGEGRLLLLPGRERAPNHAPWSWVNARGRGQLVVVNGAAIVCQLRRRLPESSRPDGPATEEPQHPLAGFWLSVAASLDGPSTIASLASLSGYSYPTVHAWTLNEGLAGRLLGVRRGREMEYQPAPGALVAWWGALARWWPSMRSPRWPKRHGPVEVVWARSPRRLPTLTIGRAATDQRWGKPGSLDGRVWATGGDHLAALGSLVQAYDSDVWVGRSAWAVLASEAKVLAEPPATERWPGIRVTIFADDHPLMRMLWFAAGGVHPAALADASRKSELPRLPGLLPGLPLLDAIESPDARVAERGAEMLNNLAKTWGI
ncbi:hypothetical protein LBMAG53_39770 [Planctomycetota bacterium]|nr:hypothetical protein LBMAG53_39770 [Planctomycetota bacterium]